MIPEFSTLISGREVHANTGELYWDYNDQGYFTVNTDGTKAVVGFAKDQSIELDNVQIKMHTPFAALFITSLERDKKLDKSRSALITVIGRARNTGMNFEYGNDTTKLVQVGGAPLLMETISAEITIHDNRNFKVFALDHDGIKTTAELPVENQFFTVDGSKDKALWYLIQFD